MTSAVKIIYSLDGSNIKDDLIKRVKEGSDGIDDVQTCCLDECFSADSPKNNAGVNILINTPCMCTEIIKSSDKDFKLIFPNVENCLLLECDAKSEGKVSDVLKKHVDFSKITKFHNSNAKEWKFMLVPTIKKMAALEKEEPVVPEINRYVIKPKILDSCADEVSLVFLEDISQGQSITVIIDEKVVATARLSRDVYVFSSQGLSPGLHKITVLVGEENYGSTNLEVQSDIEKLQTIFHMAAQKEPLRLLSILLGSNNQDREDIEREMIDILSEKPYNPAFLNLLERLLRLEPTDGNSSIESEQFSYPSLLHFCAANGLLPVCRWLLYNSVDDKRRWKNKDGLTPSELAAKSNHEQLKELLDPEKTIAGPPVGQRKGLSLDLEDDRPVVFLKSPLSPGTRRTSVSSDLVRDSGQFSSSDGSGGGSAASVKPDRRKSADTINTTSGFSKKERFYDTIKDDQVTESQACQSATLPNKKFSFSKKEHPYNDIDDSNMDEKVRFRPQNDPHYEVAWDKNPISTLPFKQAFDQQRPGSQNVPLQRGKTKGKSASLPRGMSLDGTYL